MRIRVCTDHQGVGKRIIDPQTTYLMVGSPQVDEDEFFIVSALLEQLEQGGAGDVLGSRVGGRVCSVPWLLLVGHDGSCGVRGRR